MIFKRSPLFLGLLAGTASASLFLILISVSASAVFLFIPTLPLFGIGLRGYTQALLGAVALACCLLFSLAGTSGFLVYAALIGFPALLFAPHAVQRSRGYFVPVGVILSDLALYAAIITAGLCVHIMQDSTLSIEALLLDQLSASFSHLTPDMAASMQQAVEHFGFVLIGIGNWFWLVFLYLHAVIANAFLQSGKSNLRPTLALKPFEPPIAVLASLVGVALFSVLTTGDYAFISSACAIILLFPYFLLGLSLLQEKLRRGPAFGILLFLLYFTIFALLWPAFVIAGLGLWQHCKRLAHIG